MGEIKWGERGKKKKGRRNKLPVNDHHVRRGTMDGGVGGPPWLEEGHDNLKGTQGAVQIETDRPSTDLAGRSSHRKNGTESVVQNGQRGGRNPKKRNNR